jgi:hypothetical protein
MEAYALGASADAVQGGTVDGLVGRDIKVMTRENMMVLLREIGSRNASKASAKSKPGKRSVPHSSFMDPWCMEEAYVVFKMNRRFDPFLVFALLQG